MRTSDRNLLAESIDLHKTMISNHSSFKMRLPIKIHELIHRHEFENVHNSLEGKFDKKSSKLFSLSPIINKKSGLDHQRINIEGERDELESRDSQSEPNYYKSRLKTPFNQQYRNEDQQPKEITGQIAITKFYNHYKKLDKVKDQNKYNSINDSVYTAFLNRSESLNLLPSKIGFIKIKGDEDKLKMKYPNIHELNVTFL